MISGIKIGLREHKGFHGGIIEIIPGFVSTH